MGKICHSSRFSLAGRCIGAEPNAPYSCSLQSETGSPQPPPNNLRHAGARRRWSALSIYRHRSAAHMGASWARYRNGTIQSLTHGTDLPAIQYFAEQGVGQKTPRGGDQCIHSPVLRPHFRMGRCSSAVAMGTTCPILPTPHSFWESSLCITLPFDCPRASPGCGQPHLSRMGG